jgi:2-aminoadipate transaminase
MARALENPQLISLAAGFVDQQTLPVGIVRKVITQILSDEEAARQALQYGTTLGDPELRELILANCLQLDGLEREQSPVSVDQVVLTAGSNQLLHLVAETLLDPGDIVICTSPSYFVFLGILKQLGVRTMGVAVDQQGMLPDSLEELLEQLQQQGELARVRLLYLVPYYDNPAGITMSRQRGDEILEIIQRWSEKQRIHLLVDEAYRQLRLDGDDVPSLWTRPGAAETVIMAGTFSKSFSPGIRVGWGILPDELIEPLLDQKGNLDFGSPNINQQIMREVLQSGDLQQHLQQLTAGYRVKRDAMLAAADRYLAPLGQLSWCAPAGGLYLWLELPPDVNSGPEGELFEAALDEGMLYVPGQYCFPAEGEGVRYNTIRLSFGVQSADRIELGMQSLSVALQRLLSS